MKNDIVLKTITGFLIPILFIYASFLLFSLENIDFVSLLNSLIYISLAYILLYLRFGEVNFTKVVSLKIIMNIVLIILFSFFVFLLFNLIS